MRLTRDGAILAGMTGLTLFASLASGNNLLYLLYSLMVSAFVLSWAALRIDLRNLSVSVEFPEQSFQNTPVMVKLHVSNNGRVPAYFLQAKRGGLSGFIERIPPGETGIASLKTLLTRRGRNRLRDLAVTSSFPFGLLEGKIPIGDTVGLALPRPRDVRSRAEFDADSSDSGRLIPQKGVGDELFGIREYGPCDDPRLINWKSSARSGKLLVNEFSSPGGSKVLLRLEQIGSGENTEKRIIETASACRFYILRGADVRLETPESEVDYGKGLDHLQRLLQALALLGEGRRPRETATEPMNAAAPQPRTDGLTPLAHISYVGGALVFASLFLVDEVPPNLLYSVGALIPAAYWIDVTGRRRVIPEFLWQVASLTALSYVLLIGWRVLGVTVSNTYYILFILLYLFFHTKGVKELRMLFLVSFLTFFLTSGQTISLWYFAYFILYAVFAAAWLLRNLLPPGHAAPLPLAALGTLLLPLLGLSGLAFAATPRLEPLRRMNPFVAMGLDKRRPQKEFTIRFTEDVSLGFFGQLKRSGARVMRVRPIGPSPPPYIRIRGSALDHFDGRAWTKSRPDFRYRWTLRPGTRAAKRGRADVERNGRSLVFPSVRPGTRATKWEFTLFPLNSSVLFTIGTPVIVTETELAVNFDHTDTVYFFGPYLAGVKYHLYTSDSRGFGARIENFDRMLKDYYLQLPPLDARIRQLAVEMTGGRTDPAGKVASIRQALLGSYRYSLFSDDENRDLAGFLFEARSGNCEYFASAAVILLRSLGVPARLVTGFLADEWNEFGGFFDVRQGQAHAWTEAYVEGKGWMTVDATPAAAQAGSARRAWWTKLSRYYESVQFGWYRHVIGYDHFLQRNTFMRIGRSFESERLKALFAWGCKGAALLCALAALGLALLRAAQRLRRPAPGYFERARTVLARAGLRPAPHETPMEFAKTIRREQPRLAAIEPLVRLYYQERYSGNPLEARLRREAERLLEELNSSVSAPPPRSPKKS